MWSFGEVVRRLAPSAEFHQDRYARLLDEIVSVGETWLEIGAGTRIHNSSYPPAPAELGSRSSRLVGIDFEIEHLRLNPVLTDRLGGSGNALPFRDETFSLISANMVLEHLERPEEFFREVGRVLRPGGRFVFVTPNHDHPVIRAYSTILRPRLQRHLAHRLDGRALEHIFPTYYRANTPRNLRHLARAAGLVPTRLTVFNSVPFVRSPLILTALECGMIRLLDLGPLRRFGTNLMGLMVRPVQAG